MCADPNCVIEVLRKRKYLIVGEAVFGCVDGKPAVMQAVKSAAVRTRHKSPVLSSSSEWMVSFARPSLVVKV